MNIRKILISLMLMLCCTGWAYAQTEGNPATKMTKDEAVCLLKQGFEARVAGDLSVAIEILERVYVFDPNLEAHFDAEKIHLSARGELGHAYYENKDWGKAFRLYRENDVCLWKTDRDADVIPFDWRIAECRKNMANENTLGDAPLIMVYGRSLSEDGLLVDGMVLAPVVDLADHLWLKFNNENGRLTLTRSWSDPSILVMQIGSSKATLNNQSISMPMALLEKDGRVLVPLRFLVESMGCRSIKWDPTTKIARVAVE